MISAFSKGILQIRDPSTIRSLWLSLGIVLCVFLALFVIIDMTLRYSSIFSVGWLEAVVDALGRISALILSWLLFPATISAVISLFLDQIASRVEDQHFPELPPIGAQNLIDSINVAIKFFVVLISLNIFLLFFIFTGPIYIVLYYLVNGYLISREFFELIALRRLDSGETKLMRRKFRLPLILIGTVFTFLMTVPIVNLFIPIVATATMVHLFEAWRNQDNRAQNKYST